MTVIYLVTSSAARYMLPVLVSASVVFAIAVRVTRNRPPSVLPWCLFAPGMAPYAAADTIWGLYQVRDADVPFPGVADMLYLDSYLLFAAGLVTLARQQSGRLHWADRGGLSGPSMSLFVWAPQQRNAVLEGAGAVRLRGAGRPGPAAAPCT
ncbi:hypothetical protein ACFYO2_09315 [Streptomyces sp. NPDC006602]|uniref:hypothetical protein n=1 Tax=Streptomyces sp. NPDC006602 TaxID=3364751 RepID=UPI0036806C3E